MRIVKSKDIIASDIAHEKFLISKDIFLKNLSEVDLKSEYEYKIAQIVLTSLSEDILYSHCEINNIFDVEYAYSFKLLRESLRSINLNSREIDLSFNLKKYTSHYDYRSFLGKDEYLYLLVGDMFELNQDLIKENVEIKKTYNSKIKPKDIDLFHFEYLLRDLVLIHRNYPKSFRDVLKLNSNKIKNIYNNPEEERFKNLF